MFHLVETAQITVANLSIFDGTAVVPEASWIMVFNKKRLERILIRPFRSGAFLLSVTFERIDQDNPAQQVFLSRQFHLRWYKSDLDFTTSTECSNLFHTTSVSHVVAFEDHTPVLYKETCQSEMEINGEWRSIAEAADNVEKIQEGGPLRAYLRSLNCFQGCRKLSVNFYVKLNEDWREFSVLSEKRPSDGVYTAVCEYLLSRMTWTLVHIYGCSSVAHSRASRLWQNSEKRLRSRIWKSFCKLRRSLRAIQSEDLVQVVLEAAQNLPGNDS
ncbi:Odorant-binding protein [Fukomys damarensis]|uniref:Odorant-binding protein n=1 Tax=Fukomys damarensis TaxID=885580 RepID=A0A091CW08_FUKDA|nr:Odorant-binding protein [Fukomys damarensis]